MEVFSILIVLEYVESEEPSVLIKPVWDNNSYQSFNDSLNLETIVNLNVKLDIVDQRLLFLHVQAPVP
jgi:hypothetical protein